MIFPDGYLTELKTQVEDLAIAIFEFLDDATPEEIAEATDSINAMSRCESGGGTDHDLQNRIAVWTIDNVARPSEGERPDVDISGLLKLLEDVVGDIVFHHGVDPAGTIFGFEKYENLDPKWLDYLIGWLRHSPSSGKIATLPKRGAVYTIADDVRIAVVGDWGTGIDYPTQSAGDVAAAIHGCTPDVTVHLGDVYYNGDIHQQDEHFLEPWKVARGSQASFTLNSNHDMYDGANGYLHTLGNDMFSHQLGRTHFALVNPAWVIVGLDTAGPASWERQYMCGDVDEDQLEFLAEQASTGKRLVLLTHHQGIDETNARYKDPLHTKIVDAVNRYRPVTEPWYWYWGHIHAGYVHCDDAAPYRGRCAGHGAIPWGTARGLDGLQGIEWFEQTASPTGSHRVMNGFALLSISAAGLTEQFVDQTGAVSYTIPR